MANDDHFRSLVNTKPLEPTERPTDSDHAAGLYSVRQGDVSDDDIELAKAYAHKALTPGELEEISRTGQDRSAGFIQSLADRAKDVYETADRNRGRDVFVKMYAPAAVPERRVYERPDTEFSLTKRSR